MSDPTAAADTPDPATPLPPVSPEGDSTIGTRVDDAVENLRTEVNSRIDAIQVKVDELSARLDALQGQSQSQSQ